MRGIYRGLLVAAALLPLALNSPVGAQEYPGPSPTTTLGPTEDETFAGTFFRSNSFTNEACEFMPRTNADVSFNGQPAGNDDVDADGCVRHLVNITDVVSSGGSGGALGRPQFATVGLRRYFAAVTSVKVELLGKQFAGKGDGSDAIVVLGTGANGQPRKFTTRFKAADPAPQVMGSTLDKLVRTGTDLVPLAVAGAALFGFGLLLTRVRRRERRAVAAPE